MTTTEWGFLRRKQWRWCEFMKQLSENLTAEAQGGGDGRWHVVFVRAPCHPASLWDAAEVSQAICWFSSLNLQGFSLFLCPFRPATTSFLLLTPNLSLPLTPPFFLSSLSDQIKTSTCLSLQSLKHCSLSTSDSFSLIYSVSLSLGWFHVIGVVYHYISCCRSRAPNDNVTG